MNDKALLKEITRARETVKDVVLQSPLAKNLNLSEYFSADIYFKREDLQPVRSYKLRGAFNKITGLTEGEKKQGIVCASAGNHAQGVAYSCQLLNVHGKIFMPVTTPGQKIRQVKLFGKSFVDVVLTGDNFDDAYNTALNYSRERKKIFIHPFDDEKVIAGQGTVALEILDSFKGKIDYLFVPVGGGGLAAGVSTVFRYLSPSTKIIGVEPLGAPSMKASFEKNKITSLQSIDKFVDGAAVKRVGDITFNICKRNLHEMQLVAEGRICSEILRLYNEDGLVIEPAGALSVCALDFYKDQLKNKKAVCIISGGNNDITRTEEIRERSMLFEGLKHYFMIHFPQRPGALKKFVSDILGTRDDITYFQYSKKNSREIGPAVVGIELKDKKDKDKLIARLKKNDFIFQYLNDQQGLLTQLIG